MLEKQKIVMCPPTYFRPADPDQKTGRYANKFEEAGGILYRQDPEAFQRGAMAEWTALRDVFSRYADVHEMPAVEGSVDQVYTTDAAFSLRNQAGKIITIASHFTNAKRQAEVDRHLEFLETSELHDPNRIIHHCPYPMEGGDFLYVPAYDVVVAGYNSEVSPETAHCGRTSNEAHEFVRHTMDVEVYSLHTCEPFYHADTFVGFDIRGNAYAYLEGMHPEAITTLQSLLKNFDKDPDKHIFPVSLEDANRFALNWRVFGDTIVMPEASPTLKALLERNGNNVEMVKMTHLLAGGGAGHCSSYNDRKTRVEGGLVQNPKALEAVVSAAPK